MCPLAAPSRSGSGSARRGRACSSAVGLLAADRFIFNQLFDALLRIDRAKAEASFPDVFAEDAERPDWDDEADE